MKCPHCNRGNLQELKSPFFYSTPKITHGCPVCGRNWGKNNKGNWVSFFASEKEVYSNNGKKLLYNSITHGYKTKEEIMEI